MLPRARAWHPAIASLLCALPILGACTSDHAQVPGEPTEMASEGPSPDLPPETSDLVAGTSESGPPVTDLPPNELGDVMVLEYHRLGEPENDYRRSAESFMGDLQRLYEQGYRPITVRQLVRGEIDLPRGATPVVFTFDDSTLGQFYLLDDGSVDPSTMLGMWEAFQREHPDWSGGATWCVLPAADYPSNFFGEKPSREVPRAEREEAIRKKVHHLVENGHEICNHTLYHARLDRARDAAQVQEWIGRGEDSIRVYLPGGTEVTTLALPLGMWPAERSLAWKGTYKGRTYEYEAVLEVTGGPHVSPFHRDFQPHSIKRVVMAPGLLERHLARYADRPHLRYVSDGDARTITVPSSLADQVAVDRWKHLEVRFTEAEAELTMEK